MEEEDSTFSSAATATKTPPVQASVSPEIQCGSSSSSLLLISPAAATPTCYGAGHVVSGVIDRRKCRPRGILTVGYNNDLYKKANAAAAAADSFAEEVLDHQSRVSLFPLPAEASMRWLLSSCDEEDEDQKGYSADGSRAGLLQTLFSLSSPNSGHGFSSDTCDIANFSNTSDVHTATSSSSSSSSSSSRRVTKITSLSSKIQILGPLSDQVTPGYKAVNSQEERNYRYSLAGECSPLSIDSFLGTGNVIQTPQSDSITSSDRHVSLSWRNVDDNKKDYVNFELDFVEEVLQRASLSPRRWTPDLSYPITDLTIPSSSNSMNFRQILKTWDNVSPCISSSTLENVAPSQMRISWRDGLASRIFEMDEFDCCCCLSDDDNECDNDCLVSHPCHEFNVDAGNDLNLKDGFGSPEFVVREPVFEGKVKDKFAFERPSSCAESICTNGGDLVASGESDWTLCYKNQLFDP